MEINIISDGNVIDTTNPENIRKYEENVKLLTEQAKTTGKINRFMIIRNDAFFPEDYKWYVNSKETNIEYKVIATVPKKKEHDNKKRHAILKRKKENNEEISMQNISLCLPVCFRSTKHFTINTPLGLTSEYNTVKSDRAFTVIDDISNFLNSGYGYSLSDKDAYLDITHEPLEISDNAIILMSLNNFNEIKHNKELMDKVSQRKIIVYKGELSLAINMILTENGVLPIRIGHEYDDELNSIIEKSLKQLCNNYNLEYNRPHGYNGHFSSTIDQYDTSVEQTIDEFIEYINQVIGEELVKKEKVKTEKNSAWVQYIQIIGYDRFKDIVESFNIEKQNQVTTSRERYLRERENIKQEESNLFKQTLQLIKENESEIPFQNSDNELTKEVLQFFLSSDLKKQVESAMRIDNYFNKQKNQQL